MKCPRHLRTDTVGYCSVCGAFGCGKCLTLHEGQWYCARHYKPIVRRIEEQKEHEQIRKKHPRQRLVVRYTDGRCEPGSCFALNLDDSGFNLDLVDRSGALTGQAKYVSFQDLKAVFFVKSFDGRFDKSVRYKEWTPAGAEMVVEFKDGETVRGFSFQRSTGAEPRFHLIPSDPETNNISILVERAAVKAVCAPEEYEAKRARERASRRETETPVHMTQQESMGDFYFGTRDYAAALEQFKLALAKFPRLHRLRKKVLVSEYNVGMQHIKKHEYDKALACMERILESDPRNEHARKKASQLRRILAKHQEAGTR